MSYILNEGIGRRRAEYDGNGRLLPVQFPDIDFTRIYILFEGSVMPSTESIQLVGGDKSGTSDDSNERTSGVFPHMILS